MVANRKHEIPGSESKDSLLLTEILVPNILSDIDPLSLNIQGGIQRTRDYLHKAITGEELLA